MPEIQQNPTNSKKKEHFVIPDLYRTPLRLPLYWRDEQTGILRRAVKTYLAHKARNESPPTSADLRLIGEYLRHYIFAPCWETEGFSEEFDKLRRNVGEISTVEAIDRFIADCLEIGVDPL